MTLILSLANPSFVIQVSDRRLVSNGRLRQVEESKTTLVHTADARLLCGFTGLARAGTFRTAQWLLEALGDVGPPDYGAAGTVQRFTERASKDFSTLPSLRGQNRSDKRLSVMFTGYLYRAEPPLIVNALTTNFQDFDTGKDTESAWTEFRTWYFTERRPPVEEATATFVQRIGAWQAMRDEDEEALRGLLRQQKPAAALIGKAVELVQAMAQRPEGKAFIGQDLTSAILTPDPAAPVSTAFHASRPVHAVPGINQVISRGDTDRMQFMDFEIRAEDPAHTPPMAVPRVGRNQPCPCGSGAKCKRCHGRHV